MGGRFGIIVTMLSQASIGVKGYDTFAGVASVISSSPLALAKVPNVMQLHEPRVAFALLAIVLVRHCKGAYF